MNHKRQGDFRLLNKVQNQLDEPGEYLAKFSSNI